MGRKACPRSHRRLQTTRELDLRSPSPAQDPIPLSGPIHSLLQKYLPNATMYQALI